MITGFLTFIFFFAIVGCILYGRKLIKRERVDAVFGNPERAKGGIHWVIVGSSFLLLIWLYYSWDIAKSFFPRSANELCQVGKVNESLMSLKYLFPINERQLKSTSVIETETENLNKIIFEGYKMLGLKTFFTAGPNEIRAWTIKNGFTAPNAAGVIHSDFERGFIKAEVIDFDDYIKNGGELGSKENGKLRLEGKEYLVKDGDVIHFKFNV